jgi:predicted transcriptional regulator
MRIKDICTEGQVASPNNKVKDICARYANCPEFEGLCVLRNGVPIGVVSREALRQACGNGFNSSPYHEKTVSEIMDKDFLIVDEEKTVAMASVLAMNRSHDKLYDFIVVVNDSHYVGVVTVKRLLLTMLEAESATAQHPSPFSGLAEKYIPGAKFQAKQRPGVWNAS